MRQRFEMSA